MNRGGAIRSLQGHRLAALAIDPVEKKPLHHFLPGSLTLSLAQCGCSFDCDFCQNADIAKALVAGEEASLPSIVTLICSALILHEPMSRFSLLGAGLTLAGLVLSEWDSLRAMLRQRKAVPGEKSDDCNQPLSN